MNLNLLIILGPTASGKTQIGVEVAKVLGGEILSADSRQVYRGMDIGTGKDLEQYGNVPYHLIDIVDPGYEFNVYEYQKRFFEAFDGIRVRKRLPILVGGTGMYLEAVLKVYDLPKVPENAALRQELARLSLEALAFRLLRLNPRLHNTTDLLDRKRLTRAIEIAQFQANEASPASTFPELHPVTFGIHWPRETLRRRTTERLQRRLKEGLIEEVRGLLNRGITPETLDFYGLEYRFLGQYLRGTMNKNDMFQKLNSAIHQFAKRQETWFRRMERQGIQIHWVEGGPNASASILGFLQRDVAT